MWLGGVWVFHRRSWLHSHPLHPKNWVPSTMKGLASSLGRPATSPGSLPASHEADAMGTGVKGAGDSAFSSGTAGTAETAGQGLRGRRTDREPSQELGDSYGDDRPLSHGRQETGEGHEEFEGYDAVAAASAAGPMDDHTKYHSSVGRASSVPAGAPTSTPVKAGHLYFGWRRLADGTRMRHRKDREEGQEAAGAGVRTGTRMTQMTENGFGSSRAPSNLFAPFHFS